ncbi:MAG TPA: hypothetical protein VJN18_13615 [Polyangiaceae bacterium]|nr:hypothetical protein [Polyangiaceae bacterium]
MLRPCLLLLLIPLGCAARSAQVASAPGAGPTWPAEGSGFKTGGPSGASAAAGNVAAVPVVPLPGGEEPTPDKALPELRIEALGIHIGGGKNDAEEKAPFHRALERQFPALLECYRLADDPWAGGSFGIDLKIPRAGGPPQLEQLRTKIRGAGFQDCMLAALGRTQFEKPKAGPTVISYSVRFTLGSAKDKDKPKR